MRIAIAINDDRDAAQAERVLRSSGHACRTGDNFGDACLLAANGDIDFLFLDCHADDEHLAALRHVRDRSPLIPILALARRDDDEAISSMLNAGASDYIVAPLRAGELATRVRILMRSAYPPPEPAEPFRIGPYAFDTDAVRLTVNDIQIHVTQKEFRLALVFFRHLGHPLSRAYLRDAVWPGESELPTRTMDTHVSRVRSKLGLKPSNGFRLAPVYSYGYRLEQIPR